MKFPQKNIIDSWISTHGQPEVAKYVEKNLALTEKIQLILNEKGIKKVEFAEMMQKKPSQISKWLSGTHNLTLKTINKIEFVLGVTLIHIEPQTEYIYLGSIAGGRMNEAIDDYNDSNIEYIIDEAV